MKWSAQKFARITRERAGHGSMRDFSTVCRCLFLASLVGCLCYNAHAQTDSSQAGGKDRKMDRVDRHASERKEARERPDTNESKDTVAVPEGARSYNVDDRRSGETEHESRQTFQMSWEPTGQTWREAQSDSAVFRRERLDHQYSTLLQVSAHFMLQNNRSACFGRFRPETSDLPPQAYRFSQSDLEQQASPRSSIFWIGNEPDHQLAQGRLSNLNSGTMILSARWQDLIDMRSRSTNQTGKTAGGCEETSFSNNWPVRDPLGPPRHVIYWPDAPANLTPFYSQIRQDLTTSGFGRSAQQIYVDASMLGGFIGRETPTATGLNNFGPTLMEIHNSAYSQPLVEQIHDPHTSNRSAFTTNTSFKLFSFGAQYVWGDGVTESEKKQGRAALKRAREELMIICLSSGVESLGCKQARRAYDLFGREGVPNGVTIDKGELRTDGAAAETSVGPPVKKTKHNPTGKNILIMFAEKTFRERCLEVPLMHEGIHGADGSKFVASGYMASANPRIYYTEFEAFIVASIFAQACSPGTPYGYPIAGGGAPGKNPHLPQTILIHDPLWLVESIPTMRSDSVNKLLAVPKSGGGFYGVTPEDPGPPAFRSPGRRTNQ